MNDHRSLHEVHIPDRRRGESVMKRFNAWFLNHLALITVGFAALSWVLLNVFNPFEALGDRVTNIEGQVVELRVDVRELQAADSLSIADREHMRRLQESQLRLGCLTASEERLLLMAASDIPCAALLEDLQIPLAERQVQTFEQQQRRLP